MEILRQLNLATHHPNLPKLIFHSLHYQELGISPYGVPIDPGNSIFKWPGILTELSQP